MSHEALPLRLEAFVFDAYGTLFDVHSVMRRCEDDFLVITAVGSQLHDRRHLERYIDASDRVAIVDVSSGYAMLGLMGPRARKAMQALTSADPPQ